MTQPLTIGEQYRQQYRNLPGALDKLREEIRANLDALKRLREMSYEPSIYAERAEG